MFLGINGYAVPKTDEWREFFEYTDVIVKQVLSLRIFTFSPQALIGDLRAKNESFLETTSFVSAASVENNSNKKASKKEKEAAKKQAEKEKERKRSKVKTTKSLGGSGGGGGIDDSTEAQQPERKTRSLGEMLNPLTANFISYSHPNTPMPQKRSSQDDGSLNGDAVADGSRSNGRTTPRLGSYRQQRSVSRVRRVPISARSSGIDKPDIADLYSVVSHDNHQSSSSDHVISPSTVAVSANETVDSSSKEEASLEDEAISIRSNNSEYSCSDDNAALDLSDDATQHHHYYPHHHRRRHGDAVISPVQSAASSSVSPAQSASTNHNGPSSRMYLDYHLQRSKIQSLSMVRKVSQNSWETGSCPGDESIDSHVVLDNDAGGEKNGRSNEEMMRRLIAENAALKKQLDQLQANQLCHQTHNYSILTDLSSLKQTTV